MILQAFNLYKGNNMLSQLAEMEPALPLLLLVMVKIMLTL